MPLVAKATNDPMSMMTNLFTQMGNMIEPMSMINNMDKVDRVVGIQLDTQADMFEATGSMMTSMTGMMAEKFQQQKEEYSKLKARDKYSYALNKWLTLIGQKDNVPDDFREEFNKQVTYWQNKMIKAQEDVDAVS